MRNRADDHKGDFCLFNEVWCVRTTLLTTGQVVSYLAFLLGCYTLLSERQELCFHSLFLNHQFSDSGLMSFFFLFCHFIYQRLYYSDWLCNDLAVFFCNRLVIFNKRSFFSSRRVLCFALTFVSPSFYNTTHPLYSS